MFLAGYMVVNMLPANVSFADALQISGKMGKLNVITTGFENGKFNWSDQYNLLSGLIGGFFLALSYFGTDQSQVGRYLTAKSLKESRLGLLMNGLVKVPMQFAILLIGALVFTFYQFNKAPIFFNQVQEKKLEQSVYKDSFLLVKQQYDLITVQKQQMVIDYSIAKDRNDNVSEESSLSKLRSLQGDADRLRGKAKSWLNTKQVGGDGNDTNYIFLRFVVDHLPIGLVGLLIAIIFLASWGSIAAALNSLSSSTMIDFRRRFSKKETNSESEYRLSKWYTLAWGIFCIIVAMFTYNIGNSLIEAVNVLGSLFYGVILGVFLVAFFIKNIKNGTVVFWAALLAELLVITVFILTRTGIFEMGFLWLNPIGAFGVVLFSLLIHKSLNKKIALIE
jgi:Na+/proline symporter